MKKIIINAITLLLVICLISSAGFAAEKKLAQSGFQFLSVVSDAKASALAEAMTSLSIGSSALFFNPAGMASMNNFLDFTASHNQWIADIKHSTFSLAVNPAKGHYGVFGLSLQTVDYGDFYGTRVDKAVPKGYVDTKVFSLDATAVGFGYAKQLTDKFSVGAQIRWVNQDLGETLIPDYVAAIDSLGHTVVDTTTRATSTDMTPLAYDFGTQYKPGFHSLVFGMSVRNFSKELEYVEEGFQLPLVFSLGISMDVLDLMGNKLTNQSLYVTVDASHYRSHPEQIKIGLDYCLMNKLSLRCGYISNNDETGFSYGVGAAYAGLAFDYSYTPFGIFDNVQRMTVRFSL
jgi:hypothetical protein